MYQTDGDDLNLGKISLQCGRRNDAFKLWTLWKSIGTQGIEAIVDNHFHLADVALNYVQNNPDYKVFSHKDSLTICFNYKDFPADKLCNQLYEKAKLMIGFGRFNEDEFIRLVSINPENTEADMLNFFKVMEDFAANEYVA